MGNVPIENVPNAPKTGSMGLAGASSRTYALAPVTRGRVPNFSRAISSVEPVMHPYLQSMAKQNMAAGARLGAGIGQFGAVLSQINERMLMAENVGDEARVKNAIESARLSYAENKMGTDSETWHPQWAEQAKVLKEEIKAMGLSPMMQERADVALIDLNGSQTAGIRAEQLNKRWAENGEEGFLAAETSFNDGNWDDYQAQMEKMYNAGYMKDGTLGTLLIKRRKEFVEKTVMASAVDDPSGALAELDMLDSKTGKPLYHTEIIGPEREKLKGKIITLDNAKVTSEIQAILRLPTEEPHQVEEAVAGITAIWKNGDMSHGQMTHWVQNIRSNAPLDVELYNATHDEIMGMKAEDWRYDATVGRGAILRRLTTDLGKFPEAERRYLSGMLMGQAGRGKASERISRAWKNTLEKVGRYDKLYRRFGDARMPLLTSKGLQARNTTSRELLWMKDVDPVKNEERIAKYKAAIDAVMAEAADHPDWTEEKEIKEWLGNYMKDNLRGKTAGNLGVRATHPTAVGQKEAQLQDFTSQAEIAGPPIRAVPVKFIGDESPFIEKTEDGLIKYGVKSVREAQEPPRPMPKTSQIGVRGNFDAVTVSSIKPHLGGNLADYSQNFIDAGRKYRIDPRFLAAIAKLETGNGTSAAFRRGNNAMGISTKKGPRYDFATVGDSILEQARKMARKGGDYDGLNSIRAIGETYAPSGAANDVNGTNHGWGANVGRIYSEMVNSSVAVTAVTQFDVSTMTWNEVKDEYYDIVPSGINTAQAEADINELRHRWENERVYEEPTQSVEFSGSTTYLPKGKGAAQENTLFP